MAKKKSAAQHADAPEAAPPRVKVDAENPKLSKAMLERLLWLNTRRRSLEFEARKLRTEEDQLRDVAFAWLEERGVKSVKKFGIRVGQKIGRAYVAWQKAFIAECGSEAADKLAASAPKSVSLEIVREV